MCGLCGVARAEHHWSESPLVGQFQRHRERLEHIKFINKILVPFRFKISDFANNSYVVKNATGRTQVVQGIESLWNSLGKTYTVDIDPLDEKVIRALRNEK